MTIMLELFKVCI